MNVGIIGVRSRNNEIDKLMIRSTLLKIHRQNFIDCIVSGGAVQGGDRFAEELADEFKLNIRIFYPRTNTTPDFLERNKLIASNSDLLIACVESEFNTIDKIKKSTRGGTNFTVKQFLIKNNKNNLFLV